MSTLVEKGRVLVLGRKSMDELEKIFFNLYNVDVHGNGKWPKEFLIRAIISHEIRKKLEASNVIPMVEKKIEDIITVDWFHHTAHETDVISVKLEPFTNQGGLSSDLFKVHTVHKKNNDESSKGSITLRRTRLIKTFLGNNQLQKSKYFGLAREGLFLANFTKSISAQTSLYNNMKKNVAKIYYSHGNLKTGEKLILMDMINGVQSGLLFGDHSPHNWGKDLTAAHVKSNGVSAFEVAKNTFRLAAKLHASHWMDRDLLKNHWMRGAKWIDSIGKKVEEDTHWRTSQNTAIKCWKKVSENHNPDLKLDPHLVKCINISLKKINYNNYLKMFRKKKQMDGKRSNATNSKNASKNLPDGKIPPTISYPWSFVHGDFFPGNIMWTAESGDYKYKLVDFEMVGVGSGAQDLGQYTISHMHPDQRRKFEYKLVKEYYAQLVESLKERQNADDSLHYYIPSFHEVLSEYKHGGAGRFVWFVCFLLPICPTELAQYFHDQLAAFLHDHFPNPADVGMPRV